MNKIQFLKKVFTTFGIFLAVAIGSLAFFVGHEVQGTLGAVVSGGYAILVTLVFGIQVYGFILSQTDYGESMEEPKFRMLQEEAREWGNYPQ